MIPSAWDDGRRSCPDVYPGLRIALLVLVIALASGCSSLAPSAGDIPPVYRWTECYPVENDLAQQFGILVDYCADPEWDGRHWGLVAYRRGTLPEKYLGLAWGIWYSAGRRPNLAQMRVVFRMEGGDLFIGASGARPRFQCRNDERGECVAIVATLKGPNGTVAERVVSRDGAGERSSVLGR
jgi:hypothetical protein